MALKDIYAKMKRAGFELMKPNEPAKPPAMPDPEARIRTIVQTLISAGTNEQVWLKDDSVYALMNIFSDTLLGNGWGWEGDDAERLRPALDKLTEAKGFTQMLEEISGAMFQRTACVEIVWQTAERLWCPCEYRVVPPATVQFDTDELGAVTKITVNTTAGAQEIPQENCLLHFWRPTFEEPTGQTVYTRLKEVFNYKRRADLSMILFIERFATPSIVGYYAPGTSTSAQNALLTALKSLQSAAVGVLPGPKGDSGNSVEMIESQGESSGVGVGLEMLKMYERRMARAVLGSVLAVFESEFGTRAQADTHAKVLQQVVKSYQSDVEEPINEQLVRPWLAYNDQADADVRFALTPPDFSDPAALARVIADLAAAGFLDPSNMEDQRQIRSMFGIDSTPTIPELPEAEPKAEQEAA